MNERIKELMEQTGYKPLPGFDFANSLEEQFMEKFAELIIRECAKVANDNFDKGFCPVGEFITEHFGVE